MNYFITHNMQCQKGCNKNVTFFATTLPKNKMAAIITFYNDCHLIFIFIHLFSILTFGGYL